MLQTLFNRLRSSRLTTWIFLSLVAGLLIGAYAPEFAQSLKPFRTLFLNGIKCIVAPLIFSSIVIGIASAGSVGSLGRTGFRAIVYFELATTFALAIGLLFANWVRPGDGISVVHDVTNSLSTVAHTKVTFGGFVEHLLPSNFAEAIVKGDVLQVVIFSVLFGMGVMMAGEKGAPMLAFCQSMNDVMFRFTAIVMTLAPLGVGASIASSVAENGVQVILPLLKLVGTLYFALFVFGVCVLIPALLYSRVKIGAFWREIRPCFFLAFATSSSESAYPLALQSLNKIGIPRRISSFVLPLGYSFNLDGSTLHLALASVFIAQAAKIELSLSTQITMMLTLMLTTKGVAAVPRASLVVLSGTLTAFGLPLEGVALILGVDTFMDMARTSINLLGNCVATAVVTRWEGEKVAPEYQART